MERKAAYANLAKWFEYLNDDCGYENWSQYLLSKLRAYPLTNGLDVGCGGGWFTRAFHRAGYQMTGLDASAEMLDFAQAQAVKEGARGEYLLGDITKFRTPKKFSFITAINDCINYIPPAKLSAAFKNMKNALQKGGVLLFDVSSPRKFRDKIANTVSVDDRDDVTYLSFNRAETDGASMDVTLFVKRPDGTYDRLDETHRQYLHTEESLTAALNENGFTVLEIAGHLGEDKAISDRLVFLAQK
ncbi:MAG: methyltransferase domain-containing protein [Clostridia bacterium]|nr:methyltransferase domain-containing protein [Clostridia bacterium]